MRMLGVPELIVLSVLAIPVLLVAIFLVTVLPGLRRRAREGGYPSLGEYLRAAPRTDQEKRDAVDLAMKGGMICLLGLLFPPLILLGLFPLFYGARKIAYASMGLGLVDDSDPPFRPR